MGLRTWAVIAAAAVCSGLVVAGAAWWTWRSGAAAEPVMINMTGGRAEGHSNIFVIYIKPDKKAYYIDHVAFTTRWHTQFNWIETIYLRVPEKELRELVSVEVTIGTRQRTFTREQIESTWQRVPDLLQPKEPALVVEVPNEEGYDSSLAWVPRLVNWPGDGVFVRAVWNRAAGPLVLIGLATLLLLRKKSNTATWWRSVVTEEVSLVAADGRWWNGIGWSFLILSLAFLEVREPYYFTQDDNMDDCLPMLLVGCRNLWDGRWPQYNPYVFLGVPLASQGMYALTYPPTLASYAIARHLLGNEFMTVEVFAILHVFAAFWTVRLLGRKVGMGTLCANVTGLSISLSGAVLILGRCWFNFIPTTVWLAVLFLGLIELTRRQVGWRWLLSMGLAAAMPFHVGFSQLALYTHGLLAVAALYLMATGVLPWRRALFLVAAWLLGAGLSLPIVSQQWELARGMTRLAPPAEGIGQGWGAFYLPYPLVQADAPSGWANVRREYMGSLYFAGGVLAWCATLQAVGLLIYRPKKPQLGRQVWLFLAVFTFWLALGPAGGLWLVLERLPLVGFINRYPLRLLPFVTFFVALAGGLVLQRFLSEWDKPKQTFAATVMLLLLGWQVIQCWTAFYTHAFTPYSPLPSALAEQLVKNGEPTGRLNSWAPLRSSSAENALRMPQNYPAVYKLPALGGYNSLLEGNPLVTKSMRLLEGRPIDGLRAYGVVWHLLPRDHEQRPINIDNVSWWQEIIPQHTSLAGKVKPQTLAWVAETEGVTLRKLDDVDPLAFVAGSKRALPVELHGEGIDVRISDLKGDEGVVVNFLRWPEMVAAVDGTVLPCGMDDWGRAFVTLAGPGERLLLRYRPNWGRGMLPGFGAIVVGVILFGVMRLRQPVAAKV